MENFDDVLFASDQPQQSEQQSGEYDIDSYKEKKQQERDAAYSKIDEAALALSSPEKLKGYLDIQSRFDLYRPGNVLLIQSQMPTATRLKSYDEWRKLGAGVRRDQRHIVILKSGKQFARDNGTIGQYTNVAQVFDVSQTFSAPKFKQPVYPEGRDLIKALMSKSPVPAAKSDNLPEGVGAYFDPKDNVIYVRPGMDAPDIFRSMSVELSHAELSRQQGSEYSRDKAEFAAYCSSYVLCQKFGVDVSGYNFENASQQFEGKDAKSIREDLSDIREASGEIVSRVKDAIQQDRAVSKEPKEQEADAR